MNNLSYRRNGRKLHEAVRTETGLLLFSERRVSVEATGCVRSGAARR